MAARRKVKKREFYQEYWAGENLENCNIVRLLAIIIFLSGIMVTVGWVFGIEALKSVLPGLVTMKFTTAISFIFVSIIVFFSGEYFCGRSKDVAEILLPVSALAILLVMTMQLASSLTGVESGIEFWVVRESPGAAYTVVPGRPSIPTMLNFMFITIAALLIILKRSYAEKHLKMIGGVVGIVGLIALIGYLFSFPLLYYYVSGVNTAMALNTAVLFILSGIGLVLASKSECLLKRWIQ